MLYEHDKISVHDSNIKENYFPKRIYKIYVLLVWSNLHVQHFNKFWNY